MKVYILKNLFLSNFLVNNIDHLQSAYVYTTMRLCTTLFRVAISKISGLPLIFFNIFCALTSFSLETSCFRHNYFLSIVDSQRFIIQPLAPQFLVTSGFYRFVVQMCKIETLHCKNPSPAESGIPDFLVTYNARLKLQSFQFMVN